jgi:hypothetical protein
MTFFNLADGGGEDTSKDCFGGAGADGGLSATRARAVVVAPLGAALSAAGRSTLLAAV